jgi:ATP-dependent Lon protease
LRGRVLPIGGLKEKLLAAHRGGLKTVLMPRDNERELSEIPDNIKRDLTIIPVATVDEVLANALVADLTPIEWDERADLEASVTPQGDEDDIGGVLTH